MQWLIKRGFEHDQKYLELIHDLKRVGITHTFCNVIPFSDDGLILENDLTNEPIFSYGSYTLSKIVKRKGYAPGSFISPKINFDSLKENYGKELFNSDMIIGEFGTINPVANIFFVRPMEDSKSFDAKVMNIVEFKEFQNRINNRGEGYSTVTESTKVLISTPKEIDSEYRFFIVDGKISTYSQYKLGDTVLYSALVDDYIVSYVKEVIKIWEPDLAYVLDVAVSNGVPKILEINSINSSGLYAIDTQKLIFSIEDLTDRYKI